MKKRIFFILLAFSILFPLTAQNSYWENDKQIFNSTQTQLFPKTISSYTRDTSSVLFFEEVNLVNKTIRIKYSQTKDTFSFQEPVYLSEEIPYTTEVPELYSVCQTTKGIVSIPVIAQNNTLEIYTSSNKCSSFEKTVFNNFQNNISSPKIYELANGSFILFLSQAQDENYSLIYSISKDGKRWNDFKTFAPQQADKNSLNAPFSPFVLKVNNTDIIVYQSHYSSEDHLSFQLFSSVSKDGGQNWSKPNLITSNQALTENNSATFDYYNNQKPFLYFFNKEIYLIWEQKSFTSSITNAVVAKLSNDGKLNTSFKPVKLNETENAASPELFLYQNVLYAIYFDRTKGNENIFISKKNDLYFEESIKMSQSGSSFGKPLIADSGKYISYVWQKNSRISTITMDRSTPSPKVSAKNFTVGKAYSFSQAGINISASQDSSGVKGFSYLWTQNPSEQVSKDIMIFGTSDTLYLDAPKDGNWYLKLRQTDYAGNWSEESSICFTKDTTPPEAPYFLDLSLDEAGFLTSNSFIINWEESEEDDAAGYTWSLEYLGNIPSYFRVNKTHSLSMTNEEAKEELDALLEKYEERAQRASLPPSYIRGTKNKTSISYMNRSNGIYVFTIQAIDKTGNISEPERIIFAANKYVPRTTITSATLNQNDFNDRTLEIIGNEFTYEGTISAVYLDKDGIAPYDYIFTLANNDYKVASNSRISDLKLQEIEEGDYKIGIIHSDRGLYFSKDTMINIKETATVKQKIAYSFETTWKTIQKVYRYNAQINTIILVILSIVFLLSAFIFIKSIISLIRESIELRHQVYALIEGDYMKNNTYFDAKKYKTKGFSLHLKLILNSVALVTLISLVLIFVFRNILISTQQETLSKGLFDRTQVMLNSMEQGAKTNLPLSTLSDNLSLQDTANQISALEEAKFVTITGFSEDMDSSVKTTAIDFVWATTNENIDSLIDSESYNFGQSRIIDEKYQKIISEVSKVNEKVIENAQTLSDKLSEVSQEALSLSGKTDDISQQRINELDEIRKQLIVRLNEILETISKENSGSFPEYNTELIDSQNYDYLFYRPVIYRQGTSQNYVHGVVFIEVSTESLVQKMDDAKSTITHISLIILIISLLTGYASATIMATIITRPINHLVNHVALIRDEENKENLEGKEIQIKSKDEIGTLGDTVNEMTKGLVQAAKASKNLILGKEIQTKFIPLSSDSNGNALSTGSLKTDGAQFFCYYSGADELSGDYFDWKKIDEDHYALIKCDVSGHGVPAALIMIEVATLFLNYFQHWDMKNPAQGTNLSPVVSQINDLLESRGFKGRFAAFTLAIMNIKTGECHFCNAGDNMIHIYDSQSGKMKTVYLKETPAAGIFSSELIELKGGYTVSKLMLHKNDILFLYTDGIEEAKRLIHKQGKKNTTAEEEESEEFSPERVTEIIEAVCKNQLYTLKKPDNPEGLQNLEFDFSSAPTDETTAIMALVSIEKIFRMYQVDIKSSSEKTQVNPEIDNFLRLYFKQYGIMCSQRSTSPMDPNAIFYHGFGEDPQFDDLTLISVKKD